MKRAAHLRGSFARPDDLRRDDPPHGGICHGLLLTRLLQPGLPGVQHYV